MEIEKKRETSWKINIGNKKKFIELSSIEIGGEVRTIRFSLKNSDNSMEVEMNKERFFNFLSLISAFKDVVIGNYEQSNLDIINGLNEDSEDFSISEDMNQDKETEDDKNEIIDKRNPSENTEWDLW